MKKYINTFPEYELVQGDDKKYHNMYRGVDVGFGGYVYSEPGMYGNVALLDVGNMHGASIIALNKFGKYTKNFEEIRNARMAIKNGNLEEARKMLGGKLEKYLNNPDEAKDLQVALKLVLNSTYGIAAATFDNPLRDPRDKNNIIALRGALFMKTLQDEVQRKGFSVIHIKTDSIKIPDATPEIISFVMEFGKKYGYDFEHEATYEKFALVDKANYVAKDINGNWTATGDKFQRPYIFKPLFSKEELLFSDLCETFAVTTSLYLDMNEELGEDEHNYQFIGKVGSFCPIKEGCGGGILLRESKDGSKFDSAGGAKGWRWLESEMIQTLNKEKDIEELYFEKERETAIKELNKIGDYNWLVNAQKYDGNVPFNSMNPPVELPFD